MKFVRLTFIVGSFALLFSCAENAKQQTLLYPIDSLLNQQALLLSEGNALLRKAAFLDGSESISEYKPGSVDDWKKELEVFYNLGTINKPVNSNSYDVERHTDGDAGHVIKFKAKEELLIEEMIISYRDKPLFPASIEARVKEENSMYQGTQQLKMEFEAVDGKSVMRHYSITGGQEMFLSDSVQYRIDAEITYR